MCTFKDILEILYYIAFIVLTIRIVAYAKKTYEEQTKQVSNLLLKLSIPEDQLVLIDQLVFLELYNHGTRPAKDIVLTIGETEIARIDYIKPSGTALLPIGAVTQTIGGCYVRILEIEIEEDTSIIIDVEEGEGKDRKTTQHSVNTSALFIKPEAIHNDDENLVDAVQNVNETLIKAFGCRNVGFGHNSFRDELCNIANSLKEQKK